MSLNLSMPPSETELKPSILVVGVGGAGGNAVNNMIRSNLEGVQFLACNTDAQALGQSLADRRMQLGSEITQGLGAGSKPDVGRAAAEESMDSLLEHLGDAHMVFITAGMGGGTGTGAAPVIAEAARDRGLLTVGVVTKPFNFEGSQRMRIAEQGIEELQQFVDTLIIIPNQNLFRVANEKTTFADAFKMADDVLYSGVRGVTDLMVMPGLINLDFADIRTVMSEMGKAMMGTGEAEGDQRAIHAAESAISNPLLDDTTMRGARGVLINITGGPDMTLFEVDEAANRIREEVDTEANIIFGSTFDESLEGRMRVSVVATGIEAEAAAQPRPRPVSRLSVLATKVKPAALADAGDAPAPAAEAPASADTVATARLTDSQDEAAAATAAAAPDPAPEPAPETATPPAAPLGSGMLFPDMKAQLEEAKAALKRMEEAGRQTGDRSATGGDATVPPEPPASPAEETGDAPMADSFIPPKPAEAGDAPRAADPGPQAAPEPPRADLEGDRKVSSFPNLFRKMTGLGRVAEARAEEPMPIRPAVARAEPSLAAEKAPDAGLSKADEEMLEIPAFLRRQAN